ncbi:MAG: NADH-quinone oxidoreductase subunit H [Myxococcales bacterium]|nr:NADH-quinone oxidoreductase subunit H [Myxococcales bacterium]MCB9708763.1 NADH-quinone oxidoreductase subunit H [Myxococcales bacterium]
MSLIGEALWATGKMLFILLVVVGAFAPILVWAERRQSAMIQDRIGPVRAAIPLRFGWFGKKVRWNIRLLGLLHPAADAIKMIWKEDFVPVRADRFLHALAPIITLVPAILAFAVVPFGGVFYPSHWWDVLSFHQPLAHLGGPSVPLQVASLNVGILFVFAVGGTGVVGAAVGGYASDNKFSLLGGLRAAGQLVSYEVVLGLTLVGSFMIYGSLRLEDMVSWQMSHHFGALPLWGIFMQPVGFVMFLTAAIAESKRIPFDVPEGESEIVGGYHTEYSGMKFGMFFTGEFIEVVLTAALVVTIFLGGYHLPGLTPAGFDVFGWRLGLPHLVVTILGIGVFLGKVVVLIWFQLMIRWTLPRFRYDQIMQLCWKGLLPLALINIFITGLVLLSLKGN